VNVLALFLSPWAISTLFISQKPDIITQQSALHCRPLVHEHVPYNKLYIRLSSPRLPQLKEIMVVSQVRWNYTASLIYKHILCCCCGFKTPTTAHKYL
jgi:hypothetical protein